MAETPGVDPMLLLETYQRQLDAISRQIDFVQGVLDDVARAKQTVEGIRDNPGRDVLIPVGASTFVRGTVAKDDVVLAGIGAGYATERSFEDAIRRLADRETQVREELERLMQSAVQIQQEAAELQERLTIPERA